MMILDLFLFFELVYERCSFVELGVLLIYVFVMVGVVFFVDLLVDFNEF